METLKKYAKEGWRARIKIVKGHKYIIIRLRGKDKSLGPYNEELWKKIEALGMTPTKSIKHVPIEDASTVESLVDLQKQIDGLKRTVAELSPQINIISLTLKEKSELLEKLQKKTVRDHRAVLSFQKRLKKLEDAFGKKEQVNLTPANMTMIQWFTTKYGFEGDLSDFINDAIEDFFRSRNWRIKIVQEEPVP